MTKYRRGLPQLRGHLFLTDGGIETNLMFHDGFDLPYFAAFHLLRNREGRDAIVRYYERFIAVARAHDLGFILESPTWRASSDWGEKLGYTRDGIGVINRRSVDLMLNLRARHESAHTPIVISGCVGPRGDGYDPGIMVTTEEATVYHAHQIGVFAAAGADMVTGMTITNASEAIGIVRAARTAGMPVVISFTLETDGRLPTGQPLSEAIKEVDAATKGTPAYYMLNCAHPTHFEHALEAASWMERLHGIRANASRRSHTELDAAPDLDDGDSTELGAQYAAIRRRFPGINVLGGCCGTDHRHIERICNACKEAA